MRKLELEKVGIGDFPEPIFCSFLPSGSFPSTWAGPLYGKDHALENATKKSGLFVKGGVSHTTGNVSRIHLEFY